MQVRKYLYRILLIVSVPLLLITIFDAITHRELTGILFFSCMIMCVLLAAYLSSVWSHIDASVKQDRIITLLEDIRRSLS